MNLIPIPKNHTQHSDDRFRTISSCWVCTGSELTSVHQGSIDLSQYKVQDPDLAAYTGAIVSLMRCARCGFLQPEALPTLPNYFQRMYDQHWAADWIDQEFTLGSKDYIFWAILNELDRRITQGPKTLLDIGTHVGRFLYLASQKGWLAEGTEFNPRTAAYAADKTGLPIHCKTPLDLIDQGRRFNAITLTDVLEHIPDPINTLRDLRGLLLSGGWIAVKVPCGPSQIYKEVFRETILRRKSCGVVTNLVHLSLFNPNSLRLALQTAGFEDITLSVAAPEFIPAHKRTVPAQWLSAVLRLSVYHLARLLPGGVHTPLALNLQVYARNPL